MKNLLLLVSLLCSTVVIAGPEDHMYDSCYTAFSGTFNQLPSNYCFEDVALNMKNSSIEFNGYANNIPDNLKIQNIFQKNANEFSFIASAVVLNDWKTGCEDGIFAELIITGDSDLLGRINPKKLKFFINYKITNDTCHSQTSTGAIEYKLSK